jgi:hypothetical protein
MDGVINYIIIAEQVIFFYLSWDLQVRIEGLEPPCLTTLDPKSSASTNSAISAGLVNNPIPVPLLDIQK